MNQFPALWVRWSIVSSLTLMATSLAWGQGTGYPPYQVGGFPPYQQGGTPPVGKPPAPPVRNPSGPLVPVPWVPTQLVPFSAQNVIVVGKMPGPGVDSGSILHAVNIASPGDTILVTEGVYEESVHVLKPVNIIGIGSSKVFVRNTINNLPALSIGINQQNYPNAKLVISGMTFERLCAWPCSVSLSYPIVDASAWPPAPTSTRVHFSDVVVTATPGYPNIEALDVVGSVEMTMDYSYVFGDPGDPALRVVDSSLWLSNSVVLGANGMALEFGASAGTRAIELDGASFYAANSHIAGGNGASIDDESSFGAEAIRAFGQSNLKLVSGNTIHGGSAGPPPVLNPTYPALGGHAVNLLQGSQGLFGGDLVLEGGLSTNMTAVANVAFSADSMPYFNSILYPTITTAIPQAKPGGSFSLYFSGLPSAQASLVVSADTTLAQSFAGVDGATILDLSKVLLVQNATADATGFALFTFQVPPSVPAGTILFLQALSVKSGDQPRISNPVLVTIVP